jgi:hypothetical protein
MNLTLRKLSALCPVSCYQVRDGDFILGYISDSDALKLHTDLGAQIQGAEDAQKEAGQ